MKNKVLHLLTAKSNQQQSLLNCGMTLTRTLSDQFCKSDFDLALSQLGLHGRRGFSSASLVEAPGRYYKYELVMTDYALELTATGLNFKLTSNSDMGRILLTKIYGKLKNNLQVSVEVQRHGEGSPHCNCEASVDSTDDISQLFGFIIERPSSSGQDAPLFEENRTKQASIFTLLRDIQDALAPKKNPLHGSKTDDFWGFYGLFGYNLVFQFEKLQRIANSNQRINDLHLFLPEKLMVYELQTQSTFEISYSLDENFKVLSTVDSCKTDHPKNYSKPVHARKVHEVGPNIDFKNYVQTAKTRFASGDLFEVVPSYEIPLAQGGSTTPHQLYQSLMTTNPSPYGFMVGTGEEHVIGSSPEMYLRSDGVNIETCPISGTVVRGSNVLEDEGQIRKLLNSSKDTFELNMCTDVDRNDKSRICQPGTVAVKGRRLVEIYSHLIHTVDWVTGKLREDCDAFDAFISHMWAVTVTGAPKTDAIQWLEQHEATPRVWYGGAVGYCGFDGTLDTGLIIRTLRCSSNYCTTRVGATLLHHSDAVEEELETQVKAAAMIQAVKLSTSNQYDLGPVRKKEVPGPTLRVWAKPPRVLMIDHRDSFVHTLSDYFRQCGAELTTLRYQEAQAHLEKALRGEAQPYDLVVLSPGPGAPRDFNLNTTLDLCLASETPVFGVCLGLQAIVSYFGGQLAQLERPCHGEPSTLEVIHPCGLFQNLPRQFSVGRYHSLYAAQVPSALQITAISDDHLPMAVEHATLKISAVQFHPESLLTDRHLGLSLINNVLNATFPLQESR